ncbi:hypothetical protein [Streptomyces milbemycinicus]|uniref:Uncharacterized protein n=1 Tax=Streptomyces milbemycinicus TaxID=476552 RepID=A0ABW8LHT9_9ACTN
MTPRPHRHSLPAAANEPQRAVQPPPRTAVGEPKGAARQGVRSALGPDPQQTTVTGIQPGLHVRAEGIPVADWLCTCGHHERARDQAAVAELTERVSVGACPHRTTTTSSKEGRKAA